MPGARLRLGPPAERNHVERPGRGKRRNDPPVARADHGGELGLGDAPLGAQVSEPFSERRRGAHLPRIHTGSTNRREETPAIPLAFLVLLRVRVPAPGAI